MTTFDIATQLRDQLIKGHVATAAEIRGLTDQEIHDLQVLSGRTFPRAYRDFLTVAGHGAGRFQRSTNIYSRSIPGLRASAEALLRDEAPELQLPDEALVFAAHGGYQLWFMDPAEDADDPPVYFFIFEEPRFKRIAEHFSDYIAEAVKVSVQIEQNIQKSQARRLTRTNEF